MYLDIFKIGGNVIDDPATLESFLDTFCQCPERKILVHGGGVMATDLARRLAIPVRMHEGRRITDQETLRIAVMVYAGWINKTLVAALTARNCRALGLTGADGKCIISRKRDPRPVDYGLAGDLTPGSINALFIDSLLNEQIIPVFSPVTCSSEGQLLNTNADTIASAVALSLSVKYKVRLRYVFDREGIICPGSEKPLALLSRLQYLELRKKGIIYGGMIPKVENALEALESGIEEVYVGKTSVQL
jgi:acetylglutamate kinase